MVEPFRLHEAPPGLDCAHAFLKSSGVSVVRTHVRGRFGCNHTPYAIWRAGAPDQAARRPRPMPMTKVTTPSIAPTKVISRPLAHQERMVMRDFAAPTAKWAMSEMIAAQMTAEYPLRKKNGMMGMNAP